MKIKRTAYTIGRKMRVPAYAVIGAKGDTTGVIVGVKHRKMKQPLITLRLPDGRKIKVDAYWIKFDSSNPRRRYHRNSKRWSAAKVARRLRRPGHSKLSALIKKLRKSRKSARRNPQLVDSKWQDAATAAVKKGYPWMTWGSRDGGPLVLLGYHRTKSEADDYARRENRSFKPKGRYIVFVAKEE